jgi:hypothetical protein
MSECDVMMVMDTMAQMFETLVKRIETLEREVDELRSRPRKEGVNALCPGVVIQPSDMTQEEIEDLIVGGIADDDMDWAKALLEARSAG